MRTALYTTLVINKMLAKAFIIAALFAIIFVLFRGLYFLVKDQGNPKQTVKSLTWRIGLSVLLIILIMVAIKLGIVTPHGINKMPEQDTEQQQSENG